MVAYIASADPKTGEAILGGLLRFLPHPVRRVVVEPGGEVFLYLKSPVKAVGGMFTARRVFIAPRENLPALLQELGIGLSLKAASRYVALVEVKTPVRCVRPVRAPAPRGVVKLTPGEAAELRRRCLEA